MVIVGGGGGAAVESGVIVGLAPASDGPWLTAGVLSERNARVASAQAAIVQRQSSVG
jgi:hypothetical protein